MSAHRIQFTLNTIHRPGERKYLCVAGGNEDGTVDLDELTERVSQHLHDFADDKDAIKQLLSGFVEESWQDYQKFYREFHGLVK